MKPGEAVTITLNGAAADAKVGSFVFEKSSAPFQTWKSNQGHFHPGEG